MKTATWASTSAFRPGDRVTCPDPRPRRAAPDVAGTIDGATELPGHWRVAVDDADGRLLLFVHEADLRPGTP